MEFLSALVPVAMACPASARTMRIPDDHPTIDAALQVAQDGDVLELGPGTFSPATTGERFPLVLAGRRVTIRGAGAWRTVLDAEGEARHFHCVAEDSSTIEDLTLRGGRSVDPGGAVSIENASSVLRRLVIEECSSATEGNAIALMRTRATLKNILFERGLPSGPAVIVSGGSPRIEWCTFTDDTSDPVRVSGARAEIGRNVMLGATSPQGSRGGEEGGAFAGSDPLDPPPADRERSEGVPGRALLAPAIPNPFTPSTSIRYTVTEPTVVDLGVFNVLGQRIRTLFAGDREPGEYREAWDGRDEEGDDMPPGVYYARITQGRETETQPLVLVR
jgi:hypothetical protein